MIQIQKSSEADVEHFRMAYLKSLPAFQDIFIEFIVNQSTFFSLHIGNEMMGYAIVSPDRTLVEYYVADKYLSLKYSHFTEAIAQLGVRHIYCKTFDHLLLNYCVAHCLRYTVIGFLYRDYTEPGNISSINMNYRYACESDLPFLMAQDDEVFEPKELLETHIDNKSIFIFGHEHEIAGCGFLTRVHPAFDYYDLGVWVHPQHRRKGCATTIMQHLKRICKESGGIPICGCDATNVPSQNMLDKLGYLSKHKLLEFETGES